MIVRFLREAENELIDAVMYYEDAESGLGFEFEREVKAALKHIVAFPNAWSPRADGTRRFVLDRFPFVLIYCHEHDQIWVLGVVHDKRRPRDWNRSVTSP